MILIIMAAGKGSRFGGPKQCTSVGPKGEYLMDYSINFATKYGINKIIIITNDLLVPNITEHLKKYHTFSNITVFSQDVFVKSLSLEKNIHGTGIALLTASKAINQEFLILNGDDYYGESAFEIMFSGFSSNHSITGCLAGYKLSDTLSLFGNVNRAICQLDEMNFLTNITEYYKLEMVGERVVRDSENRLFTGDELVSMNFWGFNPKFVDYVNLEFFNYLNDSEFWFDKEFNLPDLVKLYINHNQRSFVIKPLNNCEWIGLTYPNDVHIAKSFFLSK